MAHITRGETFSDGESVTAARIHKLIDDAVIAEVPAATLTGTIDAARLPASGIAAGVIALTTDKLAGGVAGVLAEVTPDATHFTLSGGALALAAGGVDTTELAAEAVETAKIGDGQVTLEKITSVAASKLLGRGSAAGSGAPEALSIGTGLTLSGTTLSATPSGLCKAFLDLRGQTTTITAIDTSSDWIEVDVSFSVGDFFVATETVGNFANGTPYYIVEVVSTSPNRYKVSASAGGSALNLTSATLPSQDFNGYHIGASLNVSRVEYVDVDGSGGFPSTTPGLKITFTTGIGAAYYTAIIQGDRSWSYDHLPVVPISVVKSSAYIQFGLQHASAWVVPEYQDPYNVDVAIFA